MEFRISRKEYREYSRKIIIKIKMKKNKNKNKNEKKKILNLYMQQNDQ
jgi:uncharacterized protein (UPF0335 family)